MTTINNSMTRIMDSATQHSNAMTKELANLQTQVAAQAVVRTMPTRGTTAEGQMQRMARNIGLDDVVSFKSKLTPEEAAKNVAQIAAHPPRKGTWRFKSRSVKRPLPIWPSLPGDRSSPIPAPPCWPRPATRPRPSSPS